MHVEIDLGVVGTEWLQYQFVLNRLMVVLELCVVMVLIELLLGQIAVLGLLLFLCLIAVLGEVAMMGQFAVMVAVVVMGQFEACLTSNNFSADHLHVIQQKCKHPI